MNRILIICCFCLILFLAPSASLAQSRRTAKSESSRIVTVTRLVALFSDLESQWLRALQRKDEGTLNSLLAEDLQVWTPTPPGDPIPKEDWLKQALADRLESFHIRQMAVRSLNDDTAVASFVLNETFERNGKPATYDHFVVDVWRKDGNRWQVTDRYISTFAGSLHPAETNVKPSGEN